MEIVAIESNIEAGKTTLLDPLAQELSKLTGKAWKVIREPVDEAPIFLELLQIFVENPDNAEARVAFQVYITRNRQALLSNIPEDNYIIEHSLFSDLVFCHANFLTTEQPSAIYMSYYYQIKNYLEFYPQINLVYYIDREVESCFNACQARGRTGESSYTLDYFKDLKAFHDACLPQITRQCGLKLVMHDVETGFACPSEVAKAIIANL